MDRATIISVLTLMLLAFAQSVSFSLTSRSRNRSSRMYHVIASIFSNGVWFLTFRHLVVNQMTWSMFLPYTAGTVLGAQVGVQISMRIERWLGADSDSHLKKA